ncbi:MAG: DUF3641 domain-containing protein [Caldimicrobium sp.]
MQQYEVLKRYKEAAKRREIKLCCPVQYSKPELLKIIPDEILEKDYGCGDPTIYVKEGETVLDLGSGSGKHCYMMAQIVGPKGKVIGIDFNEEMLKLARKYQKVIAEKLGYWNTEFRKGKIQNLKLDLEKVELYLKENPIKTLEDFLKFEDYIAYLEKEEPLIPDNSIDTVVSNCVLNLVKTEEKEQLFKEIYRVLKPGGRAVISDIVADEDVPEPLKRDPHLWSGCISGALREDELIYAFIKAGFNSVRILKYEKEPWQVIDDIEFRSITVEAFKGKKGECIDGGHAVIYTGPFKRVEDAEGHLFELGKRIAVCERTFQNLKEFYKEHFIFIEPTKEVLKKPFPCGEKIIYRSPKSTKEGLWIDYREQDCCPSEFIPFQETLKNLDQTLVKGKIEIIQFNVGYLCNERCLHCHISASNSGKVMPESIVEASIELIKKYPHLKVDITGGAPELHPQIEKFLNGIAPYASEIFFRTNITALNSKRTLLRLFKSYNIKVIASFPDLSEEKTNFIRGNGFYKRALEVLTSLSKEGLGRDIPLYIIINPCELSLGPKEEEVKENYKRFFQALEINLSGIFVLNNFPIGRFKEYLEKEGKLKDYYKLLYENFNSNTLKRLMCLRMVNISPDGELFDCDFNQALGLKIDGPSNIFDLFEKGLSSLEGNTIKIGDHCYGCTALGGSSCFGSLT